MVLLCAIPEDHTARQSAETLEVGPSRPPLFPQVPARWRLWVVAVLALVLGAAAGAGALLWWEAAPTPPLRPASPAVAVDEHGVELILLEAAPPRSRPRDGVPGPEPLQVDGAVLLSGLVSSTVSRINNPRHSLGVRAPALPVTVSPTARFQRIRLEVTVRDCAAASRWRPVDRPFTITWRDEYGQVHLDRAGDFDRALGRSLSRYIDTVCDT